MAWINHQITKISTEEMAGVLRKLRERDIMLITESAVSAALVYENFGDLAERDKTLGNAMFFEPRSASLKFRSAPGVVHELRIRTPEHCRMAGYDGDVVIHSCRPEHRAAIERHYKPVMLKDYIKERAMKTKIDKDGYIISAETGDRVIHYECDPFKNTPCRKTACKQLGYDGTDACDVTLNPEYRLDGGRAFYFRVSKTEKLNCERVYIDEEPPMRKPERLAVYCIHCEMWFDTAKGWQANKSPFGTPICPCCSAPLMQVAYDAFIDQNRNIGRLDEVMTWEYPHGAHWKKEGQ